MLHKILLLCLVMMACNESRPYEIDSQLNCTGIVGDVRYSVEMFGTRHSNHQCKGIGACWGSSLPWEPDLLTSLSCSEQSKKMQTLDRDICKSETMTIVIDRYAGTARLQDGTIDRPMDCRNTTIFRDEHG